MNAKGGRGPDLTSGHWQHGGTDAEIERNIREGIPGTPMPPFSLTTEEIRVIVTWLRSFNRDVEEPVTGNPLTGQILFFGSGRCSTCHMVGGSGGRLGPDLSHIGKQRTVSKLKNSIANPANNLGVAVRLRDGRTIQGVRLNEDTFSLQLIDTQEKLQFLEKKDILEQHVPPHSLMPTVPFTPKQLNDLVAFLKHPPGSGPDRAHWHPASDLDVSFSRLKASAVEPQNWLTYWGDLQGTHHSRLAAITPANVSRLAPQWTFQFDGSGGETTPLVVDGKMFVTGSLNSAVALDARTGRPFWRYTRPLPSVHKQCTVMANRGFAILGDRLYMGTLDAHLVALDAKTGNVIWDVAVDDYRKGYTITHAPLAINGKIVVGVTAGECALNGFVDAFDAATGKKLWRVWSVAQPGDPARQSWAGRSAETGGSPTWMTGTYDASSDTLFWTTGNPSPDYDGSVRSGDNLYSCSVLAIDPKTGRLKWHFQFTPHDTHDWDANETPVLIDEVVGGSRRPLLIQANRNGFFYVLDRMTGEFLFAKAFARQTWAESIDRKGRPVLRPNSESSPQGSHVCPDASGATNWNAPSYDPSTNLFYVAVREGCGTYSSVPKEHIKEPAPGESYAGTGQRPDQVIAAPGAVRAIDVQTGEIRWNFPLQFGSYSAGALSTAGGLVFAASQDGYLIALDSRSGRFLWRYQTGAEIRTSPISFALDGKQYIALATHSSLVMFGLVLPQ